MALDDKIRSDIISWFMNDDANLEPVISTIISDVRNATLDEVAQMIDDKLGNEDLHGTIASAFKLASIVRQMKEG